MKNMNVRALVRYLGINENTLRSWERRYGAIHPSRSENGRRVYSEKDIERIRLLQQLVHRGFAISGLARLSTPKLRELLPPEPEAPRAEPLLPEQIRSQETMVALFDALAALDISRLAQALQRARFEMSPRALVLNLFGPLMAEVGARVERNELSIAQEHLLSALLRDQLSQIYLSLSPYDLAPRALAKSVALCTPEGDYHEFGIILAAILCATHRLRTHYLGASLPASDLADAARKLRIDLALVGCTAIPKKRQIVAPQEYLLQLNRELPPATWLWVGGSGAADPQQLRTRRNVSAIMSLNELDRKLKSLSF